MAETAVGAAAGEWLPATFVIGARLSGDAQIFQTEGRDGIERIFALAPLYEQQAYIVLGGVVGHLLADQSLQLIAGLAYPVLMWARSEEHTSELQSLMRISYAAFRLKKTNPNYTHI